MDEWPEEDVESIPFSVRLFLAVILVGVALDALLVLLWLAVMSFAAEVARG